MSKCNHNHHNHHHSHKKADKFTNFATFGELISSFISDAYWLGGLFDLATDFEKDFLELSRYGIIFGVIFAILSASGAAYAHRALNTMHQIPETAPLLLIKEENIKGVNLSKTQKIALFADFISHIGDNAAPITFVVNLATNNAIPRWGKALVQCGAILFGALSSLANLRTCTDAMLEEVKNLSRPNCEL